jgi:hypothetical protein
LGVKPAAAPVCVAEAEPIVLEAVLVAVAVVETVADPVEAELWRVGASVPIPAALLLVVLELATQ